MGALHEIDIRTNSGTAHLIGIYKKLFRSRYAWFPLFMEKLFVKKDTRPTNVGILDLMAFKLPFAGWASITHRISGVILLVIIGIGLYALDLSLSSEAGFAELQVLVSSPLGKFITWGCLSAFAYHFVAGIKHMIVDFGVAETTEGTLFAARLVVMISSVLIFLAALWVIQL